MARARFRPWSWKTFRCSQAPELDSVLRRAADRIDVLLAKHDAFMDDERDFIINYDIKYRMGSSDSDDEE